MKLAIIGSVLLAVGALAIAAGVLPASDAFEIFDRVWPILVFVVGVTVVAELASIAGVFDVAASLMARLGRHRTRLLWFPPGLPCVSQRSSSG